ncbi:hypothetical protein GCM10007916_21390 [Psychromonas marina]|uniref:TonB C-terminal domain-containing protein n=1 Tax=Psychromonas marina TaxID=88364 RepID=A0ABQ6E146_9GAMM|nr:energy transducer TonB [Psychromonas marina]GLS91071.1 hypothetical protein GCM10007916_21390 [Psychromonas marina]
MLFLRYLFSIIFSFLIHSLAFSSAPPPSLYLDLNATQKSSIAIQLVTPVKADEQPQKPIKEQQTPVKKDVSTPQQVVEKVMPKPVEKTEKVVKKVDKKPVVRPVKKEIKRLEKVQQKRSVSKTDTKIATEDEIEKVTQHEPQTKPKKIPKEVSKEAQQPPQKIDKLIPPAASASTAKQSAPKIVEKITFSARPAPIAYPHSAKRRNIEGIVLVEVWLDEQGKQTKQHIINSSGHQVLDKAALKGIRQWQFSRQQDSGQAIAYRVQVPINFGLN